MSSEGAQGDQQTGDAVHRDSAIQSALVKFQQKWGKAEGKSAQKGTDCVDTTVEENDLAAVRRMLAQDRMLAGARRQDGLSIILFARYLSRSEILEDLLAANGALDVFEAAATGAIERLKNLLSADPRLALGFSADGFTPLHYAVFFANVEGARLLIEAGADVNARVQNPMQVLPLHSAPWLAKQAATLDVLLGRSSQDPLGPPPWGEDAPDITGLLADVKRVHEI